MGMIKEQMLSKEKVYAVSMELQKAYNRIKQEPMWDVIKVYGVGRKATDEVKAFCGDDSLC